MRNFSRDQQATLFVLGTVAAVLTGLAVGVAIGVGIFHPASPEALKTVLGWSVLSAGAAELLVLAVLPR